jgi:hypothetical protein
MTPARTVVPPPQGGYEEAEAELLRRSMAAESVLQAEVALLRETCSQLRAQMGEQKQVLTGGMQVMLRPLQEYLQSQGLEVPFAELIPQALRLLGEREARAVPLPSPGQGGSLHAPATSLARLRQVEVSLARAIQELGHRAAVLEARVHDLESPPAVSGADTAAEDYGTWIVTDAQQAEVERTILEAQGRRGGIYGG